jgi:hypothetical protein
MRHGVVVIVGSGKTGKSALAFAVAELWPARPRYLLELYRFDVAFEGFEAVSSVRSVPPGSVVVIEDAARLFAARGSASRDRLAGWLSLISHRDIVVVITVQSTAILDLDFFRTQRVVMLHKIVWDVDLLYERDQMRELQLAANLRLREAMGRMPAADPRAFTYASERDEVVLFDPPGWWIDGIHSHYLRDSSPPDPSKEAVF